jgi:hypothetical protein
MQFLILGEVLKSICEAAIRLQQAAAKSPFFADDNEKQAVLARLTLPLHSLEEIDALLNTARASLKLPDSGPAAA